jgi:hypothetical protein
MTPHGRLPQHDHEVPRAKGSAGCWAGCSAAAAGGGWPQSGLPQSGTTGDGIGAGLRGVGPVRRHLKPGAAEKGPAATGRPLYVTTGTPARGGSRRAGPSPGSRNRPPRVRSSIARPAARRSDGDRLVRGGVLAAPRREPAQDDQEREVERDHGEGPPDRPQGRGQRRPGRRVQPEQQEQGRTPRPRRRARPAARRRGPGACAGAAPPGTPPRRAGRAAASRTGPSAPPPASAPGQAVVGPVARPSSGRAGRRPPPRAQP